MQKVLIAREMEPLLMEGESFFDRADIRVFTATTNDELLKIHIEESVNLIGKFRNQPFLCRTENISATGALIRAELNFAPGDTVSCSFYLPDGTRVSAQSEVVRIVGKEAGPGGRLYGITYTQIVEDVKARIEAYIRKEPEYRSAKPSCRQSRFAS